MVLCVVVGCSSKSGKHKGLKLFRIPKVITNQGEEQEKLTTGRRNERTYTKHGPGSMDHPMDHPMDYP